MVCLSKRAIEYHNQHLCNLLDNCNNSHRWLLMSNCQFCMDYFRMLVLVDHNRLLWSQADKRIYNSMYLEEVGIDCHEHMRCSCTRLLEFRNNFQCMLASMNRHMCLILIESINWQIKLLIEKFLIITWSVNWACATVFAWSTWANIHKLFTICSGISRQANALISGVCWLFIQIDNN